MTVHFIGAGPGAADLITVRGLELIRSCPVCIYAGSLVSQEIIANAPEGARLIDSFALSLDEIVAEMEAAHDRGLDVARVHSGDPSIYGATAEQMAQLDRLGIDYDVTPGVPAFAAAAAAMKQELTLPGINQSLILTRAAKNSSAMPEGETLANLAQSGATMVLHLAAGQIASMVDELSVLYGDDCPAVAAYRIGYNDEKIIRAELGQIAQRMSDEKIERTAIVFIGRALASEQFDFSSLYAGNKRDS